MKKGVVFFFLRVLISILKKDNYQKLLIVFDGGGINWRKSFLPRYKAQREGMPKELCEQMKSLKILLERINLAYLQLVDHEADDVIASFVKQSQEMFPKVTFDIFTQDKDMLQLINSNTNILKYINGKITLYNLEHFRQEYNFSPLNYIDYLSLIGDGVDNIEGVKGVGPVGAKKLVQQFSTVEKIYQKIMELPENTRGLLEKNQEIVFRNKRIISLTTNIFLPAEKYKDCHFC